MIRALTVILETIYLSSLMDRDEFRCKKLHFFFFGTHRFFIKSSPGCGYKVTSVALMLPRPLPMLSNRCVICNCTDFSSFFLVFPIKLCCTWFALFCAAFISFFCFFFVVFGP